MNCAQIEMISRVETYYIRQGQKSLSMEGRNRLRPEVAR